MTLDRSPASNSVIDVLDHVPDKGIVIDAWVRVSLVGIDLLTVEARVVVASIDTYLNYAQALSERGPVASTTRQSHDGASAGSTSPTVRVRRTRLKNS